jgi:XTP/dITP diphosphohydrolase
MKLLVATNNQGKVKEFSGLLADLRIELAGLKDMGIDTEVEETGATFEENAILKARGYASDARIWTLADDSGLEVEALGGRPGVLSARYGGEDTGFDRKIGMLLDEIASTGDPHRRARFVCSLAVADDRGEIKYLAEGTCSGRIAPGPRGDNGFGYDPIFVPEGFTQTFGELPREVKGRISHRALASAKIIRYFRDFTGG